LAWPTMVILRVWIEFYREICLLFCFFCFFSLSLLSSIIRCLPELFMLLEWRIESLYYMLICLFTVWHALILYDAMFSLIAFQSSARKKEKGTVLPYSLTSVRPGADPSVQAVSSQVTLKSSPVVGYHYFLPGLLPSQRTSPSFD